MLAVSAFFTVLIAALIVLLRDQVPPRSSTAESAAPSTRSLRARDDLDVSSRSCIAMVMFVWGATVLLRPLRARPPTRWRSTSSASSGCGSSSTRGAARDQRAARPGGPAGQADHDLAGRDPQLLRPGVPDEAGRRCPAATPRSGSSRRSPAAITCSAPSTAARSTRGWSAGSSSMEPADYEEWLERRRGRASRRRSPARSCSTSTRCAGCHGRRARPRPRARRASTAARCRWQRRPDGRRRRALHPRLDPAARRRRSSPGYEPVMPTFQGQISEEDLLQIIAYIKSLGRDGGRAATPPSKETRAGHDDRDHVEERRQLPRRAVRRWRRGC